MEPIGDHRLTLSVEEARKLLGISRGLFYEGVHTGQIPSIRIGRRILIPRLRLVQMLEWTGKDVTENTKKNE